MELAPTPGVTETAERLIEPDEGDGLRLQDPSEHELSPSNRIAFMRVCAGEFSRSMKLRQVRTGKDLYAQPDHVHGEDRTIVETAYPGDIVGLHDKGSIQVGDTFTEGESRASPDPTFARAHRKVRLENRLRPKPAEGSPTSARRAQRKCFVCGRR